MAPLCKFWAQGNCRKGDRCNFTHPQDVSQNNNRFAVLQLQNNSSKSYEHTNMPGHSTLPSSPPYKLNRDAIIADLSTERPQWILSSYAATPKAPVQLFGGPQREQSFEEMRLRYYMALAAGNPAAAVQEADALVQNAEQQMQNALSNIDGAMDFVRNGENQHPNRWDILESSMKNLDRPSAAVGGAAHAVPVNSFGASNKNAFGQHVPPAGTFGQPSTSGVAQSPFGDSNSNKSQVGQQVQSGAFGQTSALGQRPNPFGSTSEAGSDGRAGFSALAPSGIPFSSALQPAESNPFGQASQIQLNPFGQATPSPGAASFGQSPASANPFGGLSQAQVNPFGASPVAGQTSIPGLPAQINPFGKPDLVVATPNPFSPAPTASANPNPFGQPSSTATSSTPNPFGQLQPSNSPANANPFGTVTTSSVMNANPTSQSVPNPSDANLLDHPPPTVTSQIQNPFGTVAQVPQSIVANGIGESGPYSPQSTYQHPHLQSYVSMDASRKLTMFKGRQVVYKDDKAGYRNRDGSWERIWFPEGAPAYSKDTEVGDDAYGEGIREAYKHLRETGLFLGGVMPLIPPKREYCLWDF